jgi:hypothetical protein
LSAGLPRARDITKSLDRHASDRREQSSEAGVDSPVGCGADGVTEGLASTVSLPLVGGGIVVVDGSTAARSLRFIHVDDTSASAVTASILAVGTVGGDAIAGADAGTTSVPASSRNGKFHIRGVGTGVRGLPKRKAPLGIRHRTGKVMW